jgi:N-acetylglucosamine-6-phosphate deacetylase
MESHGKIVILDAEGKREEGSWKMGAPFSSGGEGFIFPGVWDFHVHGGGGYSLASSETREVRSALRAQFVGGTSVLLAALPLVAPGPLETCLETLQEIKRSSMSGEARLLGAYLEGPFINPQMAGGMDAVALKDWTPRVFLALIDRFVDLVRVVTVAPEMPEAQRLIPALVERGILVSLGHTSAGEDEAFKAFSSGASLVTHLFNAMTPFHHRAPGLALAALLDSRVAVEFIPEAGHLHPLVQRFIIKLKGPAGLLPVSDGTPLSAGGPEEALWMGVKVRRKGGSVLREDGRLFGSAITLFQGLLFLDREGIWSLEDSLPALLKGASLLIGEDLPVVGPDYKGPLFHFSPKEGLTLVRESLP